MKSKIWLTFFAVLGFNAANSQTAELSPVCTSSVKTYGVEETEENTVYYWEVSGGTLSSSTGAEISVTWGDTEGEGSISVYGKNTETNCTSETVVYTVKRKKAPSVAFENAVVCYGEPLKITLTGTAPFEVFYTFGDEEKSIKTDKTEYSLDNVSGKYKITKVKDSVCEFLPKENNEAEIFKAVKTPKIISGD
ncbi:MAG: hypothetical protein II956_00115 [Bacteroidales bacterium]|nr:hypothetical protein [Bacteroidales bacterium]